MAFKNGGNFCEDQDDRLRSIMKKNDWSWPRPLAQEVRGAYRNIAAEKRDPISHHVGGQTVLCALPNSRG